MILTAIRARSGGSNGAERRAVRASFYVVSMPAEFLEELLDLAVVVGAGEVDTAGVEALTVVVGVEHPAGHIVRASLRRVAGRGVEGVVTPDFDRYLAVGAVVEDADVRLADDNERLVARLG